MAEALSRGSRITGAQRAELATQLGARYAAGESIRAIAEDTGRSFGFVHGLVKESGVDLRSRGGATRGPAARSAAVPRPAAPAVEAPQLLDASAGPGKGTRGGAGQEKTAKAKPAKDKAGTAPKTKAKARDKAKDKKSGKKGKR